MEKIDKKKWQLQAGEYFDRLKQTLDKFDKKSLVDLVGLLFRTYQKDGSVYICGNGGSAANASHLTGDFVKGISYGLDKRFKMISLSDNQSTLMAIANDIDYRDIFVEPLKNFLKKGDLVIGISGSGNSENVVRALKYAKKRGVKTVALCGYDGGKIKRLADLNVHVPIKDMQISEDIHLIIGHCIMQVIMEKLGKKSC